MKKTAPQDMRQHFMLNQSRLSTAAEVAQEIVVYWDANEEFPRDFQGQAGFIAPVGKDPANGGQRSGEPYNFGKSSGTKDKGNMHKRLGFQPERSEKRKFGGFSNWCWRIGHKEAQSLGYRRVFEEQSTAGHVAKRHSRMDKLVRERARPPPAQKVKARENIQEKENHKQDQAGSPNEETGQRTLGDFGIRRQRSEFLVDVQEIDDFETPRVDRAACVYCIQKRKSVMVDSTELPSSSTRIFFRYAGE